MAGNHKWIIKRVGVDEAALCDHLLFQIARGAHVPFHKMHGRAIRFAGGDLCWHGLRGHHDLDRDAVGTTRPGVCGGGVARAKGDDPAALHIVDAEELHKSRDTIQPAANLVRAAALQMF